MNNRNVVLFCNADIALKERCLISTNIFSGLDIELSIPGGVLKNMQHEEQILVSVD